MISKNKKVAPEKTNNANSDNKRLYESNFDSISSTKRAKDYMRLILIQFAQSNVFINDYETQKIIEELSKFYTKMNKIIEHNRALDSRE